MKESSCKRMVSLFFKCSNLGLTRVSDLLDDEISGLAADSTFIYASSKKNIYAFRFGRKVKF